MEINTLLCFLSLSLGNIRNRSNRIHFLSFRYNKKCTFHDHISYQKKAKCVFDLMWYSLYTIVYLSVEKCIENHLDTLIVEGQGLSVLAMSYVLQCLFLKYLKSYKMYWTKLRGSLPIVHCSIKGPQGSKRRKKCIFVLLASVKKPLDLVANV